MGFEVGLGGAFVAGLLSFASPCVLPLVPPYLCFVAGVSLDELTAHGEDARGRRVMTAAVAFVVGFIAVFVALGASASTLGRFVGTYFETLSFLAGGIIILMGLHFLGVFRIPLLYREARFHIARRPAGPLGAFVIGLTFAFGWTPCVGPILAAILFVAGGEDNAARGAVLLAAYGLGIGLPFLFAALFAAPFMRAAARFRRYIGAVEKVTGTVLVLTGILIMAGEISTLSYWLLEAFPGLGTIG